MNVLVVERTLVVALAYLIFRHARTVLDGVNEVVGEEEHRVCRLHSWDGKSLWRR